MKVHSKDSIEYITYDALEDYTGIIALTTVRMSIVDELDSGSPGVLLDRLGPGLASILGIRPKKFIAGHQVHSSNVFPVDEAFIEKLELQKYLVMPSVDGLLTNLREVPLTVFTADCVPVFLYDTVKQVVGLVHAGRKGTEKGIVRSAVQDSVKLFGSDPADMVALIGASIGPCCYPVDLWSENALQLKEEGVGKVVNPQICTGCNTDVFYSYRVEKGTKSRMVSLIMLH